MTRTSTTVYWWYNWIAVC